MTAMPEPQWSDPFAASLNDYLDSEIPEGLTLIETPDTDDEPEAAPRERWRIESHGAADWAMRKVARAYREREQIAAVALAERERILRWEQQQMEPLAVEIRRWEALLTDFALRDYEQRLAEAGGDPKRLKRKGINLPHGDIAIRSTGAGRFVVDDAKARAAELVNENLDELVYWPDPEVRATVLDAAVARTEAKDAQEGAEREPGDVRLGASGTYYRFDPLLADWVVIPGVCREGMDEISVTVKPDLGGLR